MPTFSFTCKKFRADAEGFLYSFLLFTILVGHYKPESVLTKIARRLRGEYTQQKMVNFVQDARAAAASCPAGVNNHRHLG